jgi:hypothetical protein
VFTASILLGERGQLRPVYLCWEEEPAQVNVRPVEHGLSSLETVMKSTIKLIALLFISSRLICPWFINRPAARRLEIRMI